MPPVRKLAVPIPAQATPPETPLKISVETTLDGAGLALTALRGPARRATASGTLGGAPVQVRRWLRSLSSSWPEPEPSVLLHWGMFDWPAPPPLPAPPPVPGPPPPRPAARPPVAPRKRRAQAPLSLSGEIRAAFRPRRGLRGWASNLARACWQLVDGVSAWFLNVR